MLGKPLYSELWLIALAQKRLNFALPVSPLKLTGAGLTGVGGIVLVLLIFVLPVWTKLDCDRSATEIISCRLRGANLIGIAWRNQKVMPMVGAETNLQSLQGGYRYRTSLFTYEEEIPLAPFSVDERQAAKAKQQVMEFVSDQTAQKLTLRYRVPWVLFITATLFALLLSGAGLFCLWL